MKTVAVAMSGGVDSAVAAWIVRQQGFRVFGVTLKVCAPLPESVRMAQNVSGILGIPHYIIDAEKEFSTQIIQDFAAQYLAGKTPNPCVVCNRKIKFGMLWKKTRLRGAEYLATGHYIIKKKSGLKYILERGKDMRKDQSYFLYALNQDDLKHLLFPLGRYTKTQVRAIAKKHGLPNADRAESQEICFIKDNDYSRFISQHTRTSFLSGDIFDVNGKKIGTHRGYPFYTIGQRKGLRLSVAGPKFVLRIEPKTNTIVVGDRHDVFYKELTVHTVSWVSGKPPAKGAAIEAQIRYKHTPASCILEVKKNAVKVIFKNPQFAVTPGQSAVFYSGNKLLGGGIIV